MKVCLLTRNPSLAGGGIGRVSTEIRDGLLSRGHDVHTMFAKNMGLVGYFKYSFFDNAINIPKGYDIYHAITPMESIWVPKNKSIATVLDIIPITHPELHGARMGGNRVKYTLGKVCFTAGCMQALKCRRVVCISEHVKQELVKRFGVDEDNVKVIRLGIRSDLEPKPRKDDALRIGYLGQLDRRKRVDLLVKAFVKGNIDGELVLGGRGIDEDNLRELARGDKRVKFLGFVPDDKLVDFANSLDVFVFPTAIEGYGLPPVEMMSCGKPVVVLNDAIIPSEVKEHCIAVNDLGATLSSDAALDRIRKLTDVAENYKWAKLHDWNKCLSEYLELYQEVVNG